MKLALLFLLFLAPAEVKISIGGDSMRKARERINTQAGEIGARLASDLECIYAHKNALVATDPAKLDKFRVLESDMQKGRESFHRIKKALARELMGYGRVSQEELTFFMAQILHESDSFVTMREKGNDGESGGVGIAGIINNEAQSRSKYFKSKSYGSTFAGRGPVQVTGCSEYMSFLHYVNISDDWPEYWAIPKDYIEGNAEKGIKGIPKQARAGLIREVNKLIGQDGKPIINRETGEQKVRVKYKLSKDCTPETLQAFKRYYRKKYDFPLDTFGLLGDPPGQNHKLDIAFVPGVTITSPDGKRKIDAEKLIAKSAVGFWKGKRRCQKAIQSAVKHEQREKSTQTAFVYKHPRWCKGLNRCNGYHQRSQRHCKKILCISQCVNGRDMKGLEDRVLWFKAAEKCIRKGI